MQTSPVVKTTAAQVSAQIDMTNVQLIAVDELTLRVSFAARESGRNYHNVDIVYRPGLDLYDLHIHTMDRETLGHETELLSGIYFDQFGDLLTPKRLAA